MYISTIVWKTNGGFWLNSFWQKIAGVGLYATTTDTFL